jgi:transposase
MRPRGSAEQLEERRRQAIRLLNEGMSLPDTAVAVGASYSSVWRWRQAYREGGWEGLRPRPTPGRPSKLSEARKQALREVLEAGSLAAGYPTDLWTLRRVAEVIRKRFGVCYNTCHVWFVLRKLGWTCQKPQRRARERDEEAIQRWRRRDWVRLKKSLPTGP